MEGIIWGSLASLWIGLIWRSLLSRGQARNISIWLISNLLSCRHLFTECMTIYFRDHLFPKILQTMRDSHLVFNKHSAAVDAVTALQAETYITGSQDGTLLAWSSECGRPIASVANAHGESWISALSCHRNSDFILSGSSDGLVRCWKLASSSSSAGTKKRKRAEKLEFQALQSLPVPGVVNQIVESDRYWVCAVGQEHRLGRWERHTESKHGISIIRKPQD